MTDSPPPLTDMPRRAAVAVVLGAAVWPGGLPSPSLRRRSLHAARLYQGGVVRAIVGCGGQGRHAPAEATVIRQLLLDQGVPASAILTEARSTNTWENLLFARPLLRQIDSGDVVIVTDRYHAPRARLAARRLGLVARTDCADARDIPLRLRLKAHLREGPAYLWYWLRRR